MTGYNDILFIDTETTGLNVFGGDKVFGVSYALGNGPVKYVDVRKENFEEVVNLCDRAGAIVAHGTKFDAHALRTIGIDISNKNLDCTIIREQLIDEHKLAYDLDSLTGMKVSIIDDLAKKFGGKATKNVQMQNLHQADRDFVAKYAIGDINALRVLYLRQEGNLPPVHQLEKEVLKVLIKMERKGIKVDLEKASISVKKIKVLIDKAQKDLDKMAGRPINVNSTPQMRDLFLKKKMTDGKLTNEIKSGKFVLIDGTLASLAKSGEASLDAETLQGMTSPFAESVLKIRKYRKILDTFLISQLMGHQINGRVHPNYNQCRVVTGRLSCSDPNLQAVPKRDPEMKAALRPLFVPEQGRKMLKCDYDQSDVRGFAHYLATSTGDPNHPVLKAYNDNPDTDFHTFVSEMLGIPRNPGPGGGPSSKQINLAMIFNMGVGQLAKRMGMPYEEEVNPRTGKIYLKPGDEAIEVFNNYHTKIPGAADMGKTASAVAASRGYVVSICGRHLRFTDKRFTYKASGYLYQSFTADLIKEAMVATSKISVPHMQIHDELVFSIDHENEAWAIREAMQDVFKDKCDIPIRTWPEVGPNWGQTKKLGKGEKL